MFRWSAIHDGPTPGLELPGAVAGGDHEGIAAEAGHRRLEGNQRAPGRIEKQQGEDFSGQGLRFGAGPESFGELHQLDDLLAREVRQVEEVVHSFYRSTSAARSRSMCSSWSTKAGSKRRMAGSRAVS